MKINASLASGLGLRSNIVETVYDLAEDSDQRLHLVQRLGILNLSYWQDIANLLVNDPSPDVRGELALSLGATKDDKAELLLRELANDDAWQVRQKAALAASRHESEAALTLVAKLFEDPEPRVVATAQKVFFLWLHSIQNSRPRFIRGMVSPFLQSQRALHQAKMKHPG